MTMTRQYSTRPRARVSAPRSLAAGTGIGKRKHDAMTSAAPCMSGRDQCINSAIDPPAALPTETERDSVMGRHTQRRRDTASARRATVKRSALEAATAKRKERKDRRVAEAVSRVLDARSGLTNSGIAVERIRFGDLVEFTRTNTLQPYLRKATGATAAKAPVGVATNDAEIGQPVSYVTEGYWTR